MCFAKLFSSLLDIQLPFSLLRHEFGDLKLELPSRCTLLSLSSLLTFFVFVCVFPKLLHEFGDDLKWSNSLNSRVVLLNCTATAADAALCDFDIN